MSANVKGLKNISKNSKEFEIKYHHMIIYAVYHEALIVMRSLEEKLEDACNRLDEAGIFRQDLIKEES